MENVSINNTGAKIIKQLLASKGMTIKQLADNLGYSSAQVLSNKLYRDNLSLNEFVKIIQYLECEARIITADGNSEYKIQYKNEEE